MLNGEKLLELSKYFTPVHHIKGRLRVRVSPSIVKEAEDISVKDIETLPEKIDGLKSVRVNKLAATVIIEYDNSVFPYELWDDFLHGRDLEKVRGVILSLEKRLS